jgi:hypothetical protein
MRHERETGKRTYAEAYPFPNPPLLDQAGGVGVDDIIGLTLSADASGLPLND